MNNSRELTEDAVLKIMENYDNDPQQLIAVLLDIQAASGKNYVDKKWAQFVSKKMNVPLSKIFDVLTFYAMFSIEPRGEYIIEICESAPCHFGCVCNTAARQLEEWFGKAAGIKMGNTSEDGKITLSRTSCIGACDIGPAVKIGDDVFGNLDEAKVGALVNCIRKGNLKENLCLN